MLPVSCDVLEWEIGTWLLLARGFSLLCIVMSGALELCVVHWSFPTKRRVLHLLSLNERFEGLAVLGKAGKLCCFDFFFFFFDKILLILVWTLEVLLLYLF